MRAITFDEYGGPEVLRWDVVPDPVAAPGEVLVRVAATALNRADVMQVRGRYDAPPGASKILGLECSGTIVALGEGVAAGIAPGVGRPWAIGDEVCALLAGGGYAEYVAVPVEQVLPVPAGISLVEAAALPEAACTVWSSLCMPVPVGPDDVVLVHGGSGGIGTFAIQLATALGARVAATAGDPERVEVCRQLGAALAIDYRAEDFVARVREWTDGRGADVILDVVGGEYLTRNLEALADDGVLTIIGLQGGTRAEIDLRALLDRRQTVRATKLRNRPVTGRGSKAAIVEAVRERVWPLIAAGAIRPVATTVVPVTRAAEFHAKAGSSLPTGKVVFRIPDREEAARS